MRPQQWFKSASIFFGVVISIFLYEYHPSIILKIIIAFIATSLLSSSAYVLNDLADVESDRRHPTKRHRPLASGKITTYQANSLILILLLVSLSLLFYLNPFLVAIGLIFIVNNVFYSFQPFRLKDYMFLDIIIAGIDFPLRVLIGWYSINTNIVPSSVLLFPFFISCFLLSAKRRAEQKYLGKKAGQIKKVYQQYTPQILDMLINVFMVFTTLYYFLFSFLLMNANLFWLGPVFYFLLAWYKGFIKEKSSVVKKPEQVFTRKKMFTLTLGFFVVTWVAILLFFP
jgi:4-hydroxybenzoate polyprenyltransferase